VSRKHKRIAALVEQRQGHQLGQHYVGFFDCFNRQLFYEAHEVLEHIWLKDKHGPNGAFYKGLIQLAGAFVHLQRKHPQPAAALFKLAYANLEKYPRPHEQLDLAVVLVMIKDWLSRLESKDFSANPLTAADAPQINLLPAVQCSLAPPERGEGPA
jgi:predicted metal-dependent hydrolase